MSIKDHVILAPMDKFDFELSACQILWGLINLVASNYFVEPSVPALRWFVGGRMRQPRMTAEPHNHSEPRLHPRSKDPIWT
jgi:hypothetical protein